MGNVESAFIAGASIGAGIAAFVLRRRSARAPAPERADHPLAAVHRGSALLAPARALTKLVAAGCAQSKTQAVLNVYSAARVCEILPEHPVAALGYLLFQNLLSMCWYVATLAFLHFSMSALLQSEIPTALAERVLPGPQTFSANDISLSALLSRADANKDYCLDTGEMTALADELGAIAAPHVLPELARCLVGRAPCVGALQVPAVVECLAPGLGLEA